MPTKSQQGQSNTTQPPTETPEALRGPGPTLDGLLHRLSLIPAPVAAAALNIPALPFLVTDDERRDMLDKLGRAFPITAIKMREISGGKQASYIEGATCIRRLNLCCPYGWDFNIIEWRKRTEKVKRRIRNTNPAQFETIDQDVVEVLIELTIYGLGKRQAFGIQEMGSGADMLKGAATDGLKKAASLFNVALELYGDDFETEAMREEERIVLRNDLNKSVEAVFGPLGNVREFFSLWLKRSVGVNQIKDLDNRALKVLINRLNENKEAIQEVMKRSSEQQALSSKLATVDANDQPIMTTEQVQQRQEEIKAVVPASAQVVIDHRAEPSEPQTMREAGQQATAARQQATPPPQSPLPPPAGGSPNPFDED